MRMSLIIGLTVSIIAMLLWAIFGNRPKQVEPAPVVLPETPQPTSEPDIPSEESHLNALGESFLETHGSPEQTIVEDLQHLSRSIDGFLDLFKNLDTRFISNNPQLSSVLSGNNVEGLKWIRSDHPIFSDGQLVDRWGTPYLIHPHTKGEIEIRSFGPDKISGTDDDVAIHPDQRVLQGKEITN